MTREEAIEVLENGEWWEELAEWYMVVHPEHNKLHDAVDMAISALRQQDVADTDVGKNEPMTNAQKIRSMSDEELAEFLSFNGDVEYCHAGMCKAGETCRICCLRWLQMTAEEDDHA